MNKKELSDALALKARINKKDAIEIVSSVFDIMMEALENGEEVKIAGFGIFESKQRKNRIGVNPITKEPIAIPAMKSITFKASKTAKDKIN